MSTSTEPFFEYIFKFFLLDSVSPGESGGKKVWGINKKGS
jgi:hypothetical protein